MLFKPYLAEAILQGKKTQTRRLEKPTHNVVFNAGRIISVYSNIRTHTHQSNRLLWKVGNIYAIQPGRGKKAIGYFRLFAIYHEPLQQITETDARAEGIDYTNPIESFAKLWNTINTTPGIQWKDNPQVFVLTLELVTK